MEVEGDVYVRTHSVPHRTRTIYSHFDAAVGIDRSEGRASVHLDGAGAFIHHFRRLFSGRLCRVVVPARPTVHLYFVPNLAAEQRIDRLVQRLPQNVPKRDFDPTQRAHVMRPTVVETLVVTPADQSLQVSRIAADDAFTELMDHRLCRVQLALDRILAVPDQSIAGEDPQEPPARRDSNRFNALDD
jgi:hypothetical protein